MWVVDAPGSSPGPFPYSVGSALGDSEAAVVQGCQTARPRPAPGSGPHCLPLHSGASCPSGLLGPGVRPQRPAGHIWQQFTRLTPAEVLEVVPLFHPVWADADPADIAFADEQAAHGNFRAWAQLTAHTRTALERTGRPRPDQDLLRWAFSRLA